MAQLKEDEWPTEGEPTTAEQEGDAFKREGSTPVKPTPTDPARGAGRTAEKPRSDREAARDD